MRSLRFIALMLTIASNAAWAAPSTAEQAHFYSVLDNARSNLVVLKQRAELFTRLARSENLPAERKTRLLLDIVASSRISVLSQPVAELPFTQSYFDEEFNRVEESVRKHDFAAAADSAEFAARSIDRLTRAISFLSQDRLRD